MLMIDSSVGLSSLLPSTCFSTYSSPTQIIALVPARLLRYTMSWVVSMCVAGMAMAPNLCRASMQIQNSYLRFNISITLSP